MSQKVDIMDNFDTILFDLDGTLLQTGKGIKMALQQTLNEYGFGYIDSKYLESFIGPPIEVSIRKYFKTSDEVTAKIAFRFRELYQDKYLFEANVYNGVINLLEILRKNNYKLGLSTYKRESYTVPLIKYFNMFKYFDCIKGSEQDLNLTKKDIMLYCMERLDSLPENTIMIGDTSSDYFASKELNIKFIAVTYGYGFKVGDEIPFPNISIANSPFDIINFFTSKY